MKKLIYDPIVATLNSKIVDNLITKEELSGLLKLSESYINKLMVTEGLPYLKIGRSVRFDWMSVRSWLSERKVP